MHLLLLRPIEFRLAIFATQLQHSRLLMLGNLIIGKFDGVEHATCVRAEGDHPNGARNAAWICVDHVLRPLCNLSSMGRQKHLLLMSLGSCVAVSPSYRLPKPLIAAVMPAWDWDENLRRSPITQSLPSFFCV